MSLVKPDFRTELAAHYSAVRARLWTPPPPRPVILAPPKPEPAPVVPEPEPPPAPEPILLEPTPPVEEVAAKWREIDERLFRGRVSPKAVIHVAAAYFKIDVETLIGPRRSCHLARARQVAMYIMRMHCQTSFRLTASHFNRKHATALHSINIARQKISMDSTFPVAIAEIVDLLARTGAA